MTYSTRPLDEATLASAAMHYAAEFLKPGRMNTATGRYISGRAYVFQDLYNFTFKDEFDFIHSLVRDTLSGADLTAFDREAGQTFTPRKQDTFEELLAKKLAIGPDGKHLPGVVGTTEVGKRVVKRFMKEKLHYAPKRLRDALLGRDHGPLIEVRWLPGKLYWPVYAGEVEERRNGSDAVDPLPEGAEEFLEAFYATNPRISAEAAIAACDAIVDLLDEGDAAAEIRGRTGSQPADPDATESGTLLFTLPMSDPAFGNASDAAPGGQATANSITDDSSADATGTLGYCRCAATGTGADDHIDGEAGTSGADFNFNTVSIVSGATISMTSFTVTVPQS